MQGAPAPHGAGAQVCDAAARLCSEVLTGFADGALSLEAAPEVLRDALHVLASKDIKVGHAC